MFTLTKLPYEYDALEPYIDKQTMTIHHDKHHATYVEKLNAALTSEDKFLKMDIIDLMGALNSVPEKVRMQVRNNGGGHANHSFFWKIMSPEKQQPEGKLLQAINSSFGSMDMFTDQFTQKALNRFGSGWAWVISDKGNLSLMDTPNQDNPWMESKNPILGIDVWEHAYYLKYQNKRVEYIKAFMNVINWKEVDAHFNKSL
ncbi:superoxide dismutase [Candidatus Gottesmanbacteria bacterium]|nr:superoxide dismutase [Candidatus Gottesmanbacteria bacterium]